MHTDARTLENNSLIEGDICIIGAGVAGITLALQFLNTPYKVILLEGGGFNVDMEMQDLYNGKSVGQRYYPLQSARLHFFGGTSGHWGGFCSMLDPIDFTKRDWVPYSEWPIRFSDLEPYYPKATKLVELPSAHFDLDHWVTNDRELIPLPLEKKIIRHKMLQFSPPTRFGHTYRDSIVNAGNVFLYTYANAVDIQANESITSINNVTVKNLAGKKHTVRAKCFISACCAIQNARLLLASNRQAQLGLGNDHDLVGRFFMDHLEVVASDLLMPALTSAKLYRPWVFNETKAHAELAVSETHQNHLQILNGTASLIPKDVAEAVPANIDAFPDNAEDIVRMRNEMEYSRGKKTSLLKRILRKKETFMHSQFRLFTRMEQSPNPDSRITLDHGHESDALGMPRVILDWKLTPLDKRSIRKFHETIGQEVGRAGIGRIKLMDWLQVENENEWPEILGGGWHHIGTTRMADDPANGVVDRNCKVHGIDNLFMAGSSCFSTSGSANPTLSIIALTLRLSDHLKSLDLTHKPVAQKAT
jgi:choline dehydrogenase-like flavoprotein